MEVVVFQNLFFLLFTALIGGIIARFLKLSSLVGYIISGVIIGAAFSQKLAGIHALAEIGLILLLFSIGLELSLSRLAQTGSAAITGAIIQLFLVTALSFGVLSLFHLSPQSALILSLGFSLSSTALVVKLLEDRSELDTIHGKIMVSWLLTQDLAVIPVLALLPVLTGDPANLLAAAAQSLLTSFLLLSAVFFIGRLVAPFFIHSVAALNSRELLLVASLSLALGTAYLVSLFGISPALGAFLAGVVISETQENHAVFSETMPLRNLFVILFFISLGSYVSPQIIFTHLPFIIFFVIFVLVLKFIVTFFINFILGYRGKVILSIALGLTQIGEFSFIIYLASSRLSLISGELASVAIAITLLTLLTTPFLYKLVVPLWRKSPKILKISPRSKYSPLSSTLLGQNKHHHIIICGYGRMGRWIGKALDAVKIPFVVIDYNQRVVHQVRLQGIPVIFGDPAEPSILLQAQLTDCRAIVIAIPDRITQEEVITYCQTHYPHIPVFARANLDKDVITLTRLKVKKVIQPEFEAALAVVKAILLSSGKSKEEIKSHLKSLRRFHTLNY